MADAEPTPPLLHLVLTLGERFGTDRIDRVWVFSPLRGKTRESGLVVSSIYPEDAAADHRLLVTLRYEALPGQPSAQEWVVPEGQAPAHLIDRVISGVVARSGDEHEEPWLVPIEGRADRWAELVSRAGSVT